MACPKCGSGSGAHDGRCVTCGYETVRPPTAEEMAATLRRRFSVAYLPRPEEEEKVAPMKISCKAPGCVKLVTTAKPSAGYCYSHLVRLAPELCPPSLQPKKRPNIRIARREAKGKPGPKPKAKADGRATSLPQLIQTEIARLQERVAVLERARAVLAETER